MVNPSTNLLGTAGQRQEAGRQRQRTYNQMLRDEKARLLAQSQSATAALVPAVQASELEVAGTAMQAPLALFGQAAPLHSRSPAAPATRRPTVAPAGQVTFPQLALGTPGTIQSGGSSGGSFGVGTLLTASTSSLSSSGSHSSEGIVSVGGA